MTALCSAVERIRKALIPGSEARRGSGEYVRIGAVDLIALLEDWERIDAHLRTRHFHENRPAYPPRAEMMARVANDPGAYAGPRQNRSMGQWIADALLRVERHSAPLELTKLARRLDVVGIGMRAEHRSLVREAGAEIIDQSHRLERMRRILARYGDRVPMANCHRSDWQQEIDDALEWVADNPEVEDPCGEIAMADMGDAS